MIATQSLPLRQVLRKVAGLPIIYLARSVVLLESPSDQTLAKKTAVRTPLPSSLARSGLMRIADGEPETACAGGGTGDAQ